MKEFRGVAEKIRLTAQTYPDRIAVRLPVFSDAEFTGYQDFSFDAIASQVQAFQRGLRRSGVKPGDRIVLLFPLSLDLIALMLAVLGVGAVVTFIDTGMKRSHILKSLKSIRPRALVTTRQIAAFRWMIPTLWSFRVYSVDVDGWYFRSHEELICRDTTKTDPVYIPNKTDPALITFTSGTTGLPKAANRDHGIIYHQHMALNEAIGSLGQNLKVMHCFPVAILHHLANGDCISMPPIDLSVPGLAHPQWVMETLKSHQIQLFGGAPAFMSSVMKYLDQFPQATEGCDLKMIFIGGAPLGIQLAQKVEKHFPESQNLILYGSTEAEPMAENSLSEFVQSMAKGVYNVGLPTPSANIRIVDVSEGKEVQEGNLDDVTDGGVGEVWVSGEHVVREYLFHETANRETKIRDHGVVWHRTGDLASRNEAGELCLEGRLGQNLAIDGEMIYPQEILNQLGSVHSLGEATLLLYQDRLCLVYDGDSRQDDELFETQIKKHIPTNLSNFAVYRLSALPKDRRHNSKIHLPGVKEALHRFQTNPSWDLFLTGKTAAEDRARLSRLFNLSCESSLAPAYFLLESHGVALWQASNRCYEAYSLCIEADTIVVGRHCWTFNSEREQMDGLMRFLRRKREFKGKTIVWSEEVERL